MSKAKIRKALETRLVSMQPALATAHENTTFTPSAGVPYQAPYVLLARPEQAGYGNGPYIQRGYFQVSLRYPPNQGAGAIEARAELLKNTFYRGLSLVADGITVVVEETPEVPAGAIEGDRFVINVRIRFYADIQNGV